jgi:hypothetical protein
MKGKIMTEVTTETTAQPSKFDIKKQQASDKIHEMTMDDIAGYIAGLQINLEDSRETNTTLRGRLQTLVDTVTEFIKDNLDSSFAGALKQLANELDIELSKDVTISFIVKYEADVTVPIDFDIDSIDESDFDITIRYTGNDDVEFDNDSTEVEEFETEEN